VLELVGLVVALWLATVISTWVTYPTLLINNLSEATLGLPDLQYFMGTPILQPLQEGSHWKTKSPIYD